MHSLSDFFRWSDFIQSVDDLEGVLVGGGEGGGGEGDGEKLQSHGGVEPEIGEIETFELLRISYK